MPSRIMLPKSFINAGKAEGVRAVAMGVVVQRRSRIILSSGLGFRVLGF
jgi:hypothetical protein